MNSVDAATVLDSAHPEVQMLAHQLLVENCRLRESLKRHQARQIELVHDSVDRGVIPWTQEGLASSRKPATLAMLRPVSAPPPRQEPPVEDDTEYHREEAV